MGPMITSRTGWENKGSPVGPGQTLVKGQEGEASRKLKWVNKLETVSKIELSFFKNSLNWRMQVHLMHPPPARLQPWPVYWYLI